MKLPPYICDFIGIHKNIILHLCPLKSCNFIATNLQLTLCCGDKISTGDDLIIRFWGSINIDEI